VKQHLPGGPVVRVAAVALACLAFAAGIVVAAASGADITVTLTDTSTTAPAVVTVTTERTATLTVTETQPATTAETSTTEDTATTATTTETTGSGSGGGFPTWAIVLIVAAVIGLIAAVAYLLGRGKKHDDNALDGRTRILDAAVASAVASGWTVESSSPLEAVIRRDDERTLLTVDDQGRVTRRPVGTGQPPESPPDAQPPAAEEPPENWPSR
jgi:hypothetical protein